MYWDKLSNTKIQCVFEGCGCMEVEFLCQHKILIFVIAPITKPVQFQLVLLTKQITLSFGLGCYFWHELIFSGAAF